MPVRLAAALVLALGCIDCSRPSNDSTPASSTTASQQPERAARPPAVAPQTPPPIAAPEPSEPPKPRGPNDLTGTWRIFARTTEWTVSLRPASGMPNEYAGDAERTTPNDLGNPVRMKAGALLSKGQMKMWLGPGVIVCDAPFRTARPMTGRCRVALGEGEPGPFRAARLP